MPRGKYKKKKVEWKSINFGDDHDLVSSAQLKKKKKNKNSRNLAQIQEEQSKLHEFLSQLKPLGYSIRMVVSDGNTLFRAISDQLSGNESNHHQYRHEIIEYMRSNSDDFSPFYIGDFNLYLHKLSLPPNQGGLNGGNMELTACKII